MSRPPYLALWLCLAMGCIDLAWGYHVTLNMWALKRRPKLPTTSLPTTTATWITAATEQQGEDNNNIDRHHRGSSSRRGYIQSVLALMVTTGAPYAPRPALADIDYNRVQDLLRTNESTQVYMPGGPRPTYLIEPTDEFKENERRSMEFKRAAMERKMAFVTVLEKFASDPDNEQALVDDLDAMRELVRTQGGLPLGISKPDLVKQIRRRKAKKYWPTRVEIAYQDLLYEIDYMQSPNTERSIDAPVRL